MLTSSQTSPIVDSSQIMSILYSYLQLPARKLEDVMEFYPQHKGINQKTKKDEIVFPNRHYIMSEERRLTNTEIQTVREEREWRDWVDDHFVHIISPNVYRTWSESLETFYYFDKVGDWKNNFPAWERYLSISVGAAAMFLISKRLKKR